MADDEKKEEKSDDDAKSLAAKVGDKLIPIFVSAGGLLGFVAFAGAVIMWTRLEAMQIPPEQALDLAPQGELVAIGASFLLLFGFFGALAVMGAFLVDRMARPTSGMAQALTVLLAIEGIVTIVLVENISALTTFVNAELFVLPLALIPLIVRIDWFGRLIDDLPRRKREICKPDWRPGLLRRRRETGPDVYDDAAVTRSVSSGGRSFWERVFVFAPIALVVVGMMIAAAMIRLDASTPALCWVLSVFLGMYAIWFAALLICDRRQRKEPSAAPERPESSRSSTDATPTDTDPPHAQGGGLVGRMERCLARLRAWQRKKKEQKQATPHSPAVACVPPPGAGRCCEEHKPETCESDAQREERWRRFDDKRLALPWPRRLALKPAGIVAALLIMAIAAVMVSWSLGIAEEWWVGVSLGIATLIVAALWRIAELLNERLVWFGVAVFLSVPLLGTLITVVQNAAHPKVQALALIRNTDGPTESIQGLYVTEANEHVYFANVASEGCNEHIEDGTGRLLSVPTDEVVAMSLGPRQRIDEARDTALEMAYALTPSVETGGASVLLPAKAAQQKKAEEKAEAEASWTDTRLENAGPAVRPYFGLGLQLTPDSAEPGEVVTLTMKKLNPRTQGFGPSRNGNNVRIGGVLAPVVKERSHRVRGAEFIAAEGVGPARGEKRFVVLDKEGAYVKEDDHDGGERYTRLSEADDVQPEDPVYVKVDDPRLRPVGAEVYVPVSADSGYAKVLPTGRIALSGGQGGEAEGGGIKVKLTGQFLYRQAWHENRVTFRVPEEARTGVITVECGQLAGSPLLQVAHDPTARIAVRMRPHRPVVELSSRSTDEDEDQNANKEASADANKAQEEEELTLQWTVMGRGRGHEKTAKVDLPVRSAPYSIELTATDPQGHSDTAQLQLLRLPASAFAFDGREPLHPRKFRKVRRALRRATLAQPPTAIELDGHADDPGTPGYNLDLSLDRDERVREELLNKPGKKRKPLHLVPVRELAYGETCQLVLSGGRQPRNRRVDVFVLSAGVTVVPPKGCRPGKVRRRTWALPAG